MLRKISILFLIIMGLSEAVWAERTITFATNADFPPMEYIDKEDNITGYAIDYMGAAGMLAGFKPVFKRVAWDELVEGLNEGQHDAICSSASITEERKEEFDFSEPYYQVSQVLVVRDRYKIPNPSDLTGLRIGAQEGSTGYEVAQTLEGVMFTEYDDIKDAIDALLAKRLEGVICDDPVAYYYANTKFNRSLQINRMKRIATDEEYGIVVKKGNRELLELINKGIEGVKARGIDKELQLKWTGR